MWGHLKFTYEALNQTTPNQIALNRTMQSQSKACVTAYHVRFSLFWDIMQQSVNSLLTFWHNLWAPSSEVKKSKRENRAQMKVPD
jgi:hypothetical protein